MEKIKRFLFWVLFLIVLSVFAYSSFVLAAYWWERNESDSLIDDFAEQAVVAIEPERLPEVATEIAVEETVTPATVPEPTEFVLDEYAPITVDFDVLKEQSEDIVAWLYCEDTIINYPVVKGRDNSYYLNRLPNGKVNGSGTIFLDCQNSSDFKDFNSVLYGHHMVNGSMFGSITKYKKRSYYEEHPVMYLLTPDQHYKVELIAGYVTSTGSYAYDFTDTRAKKFHFIDEMQQGLFNPETEFSIDDKYLTLSTCAYDFENARYILIGRLIKLRMADIT